MQGLNYPASQRRKLVEEGIRISLKDLQQCHSRKELLRAADEGSPIRIRLEGKYWGIFLTYDIHKLPGRHERWSDPANKDVRLWLLCPGCRNKVRHLYHDPANELNDSPELKCRQCLGLIYMSRNCCRNRWWKQYVVPIRNMRRERQKLMQGKMNSRVIHRISEIDELLFIYAKRLEPKYPSVSRGLKRKYRDVNLIFGNEW